MLNKVNKVCFVYIRKVLKRSSKSKSLIFVSTALVSNVMYLVASLCYSIVLNNGFHNPALNAFALLISNPTLSRSVLGRVYVVTCLDAKAPHEVFDYPSSTFGKTKCFSLFSIF